MDYDNAAVFYTFFVLYSVAAKPTIETLIKQNVASIKSFRNRLSTRHQQKWSFMILYSKINDQIVLRTDSSADAPPTLHVN